MTSLFYLIKNNKNHWMMGIIPWSLSILKFKAKGTKDKTARLTAVDSNNLGNIWRSQCTWSPNSLFEMKVFLLNFVQGIHLQNNIVKRLL